LETNSTYVSSRHATLENVDESWNIRDGQFISTDNQGFWKQSLNNTIVNYYNILDNNNAVRLYSGDIIQMGDVVIKAIFN